MKIILLQGLKQGLLKRRLFTRTPILAVLLLILVVTACGGGGGGGGSTSRVPTGNQALMFVAVGGLERQFTSANGETPANYNFDGILRSLAKGYSVGNVSATGANGAVITYAISGDSKDRNLFYINATSGEITLKTLATNIEEYQFNATATDDRGMETTATISVHVDGGSPPVFTSTPYNFNLSFFMESAAGNVVGKVSAVDAERTLFDYSLPDSNNILEDLFELAATKNVDGSINIILRRDAIPTDFAVSSVTFKVNATHQGSVISSDADVTVNLISDYDGDGVIDFYDADPGDDTVNVTGNGDSGTPYIISNIYQLQAIAGVDHAGDVLDSSDFTNNGFLYGIDAADQLTKHYELANDIEAFATADATVWAKLAVDGYIGHGWTPIAGKSGQSFSGSFNGDGYAINELTIHLRESDNSKWFGLFGINNGNITALGLQDINMTIQAEGNNYDGDTTIDNIVTAGSHAGGLVGLNQENGVISYSYVTGLVNASMDAIGGLVGLNQGEISYSYSTATVQGEGDTGGLVGTNEPGVILSSYATGNVSGGAGIASRAGTVGGLAGSISDEAAIINTSYATGLVSGGTDSKINSGGIVAERAETVVTIVSSYWDNETTIQKEGVGKGRGSDGSSGNTTGTFSLTTAQLQGCGLGGVVISSALPAPDCTGLFPSSHWGNDPITTTDGATIARGWSFNAGQYPSLRVVRSPDDSDLLPTAADQNCHRNGMPLGCP